MPPEGRIAASPTADAVIHLAAQAGVRYSIENPFAYAQSNLVGHLSVLELVRHHPKRPRLVYASSSSVYGDTATAPYSEAGPRRSSGLALCGDQALERADERGLRQALWHGPGRPALLHRLWPVGPAGHGLLDLHARHHRGHADHASSTMASSSATSPGSTTSSPASSPRRCRRRPRHSRCIASTTSATTARSQLGRFIAIIEDAVGRKAERIMVPMQPGDVKATCANIDALKRDYGFAPATRLEDGIPRFVRWYRDYTGKLTASGAGESPASRSRTPRSAASDCASDRS